MIKRLQEEGNHSEFESFGWIKQQKLTFSCFIAELWLGRCWSTWSFKLKIGIGYASKHFEQNYSIQCKWKIYYFLYHQFHLNFFRSKDIPRLLTFGQKVHGLFILLHWCLHHINANQITAESGWLPLPLPTWQVSGCRLFAWRSQSSNSETWMLPLFFVSTDDNRVKRWQ